MDIPILEKKLEISFKNKDLLKQALTHRSFLNEVRSWSVGHYERLEFLGDAVIELVVSTFLFELFPVKQEGDLTELRSRMVSTTMLALVGEELGLYDQLCMSRGERSDGNGRKREYLTACAFEALVGAVYLDQGYPGAIDFLITWLMPRAKGAFNQKKSAKSTIQEMAQKLVSMTPSYETLEQTGPDHAKEFLVGVYFGKTLIAQGRGPSKQLAEEQAAQAALKLKGWDTVTAA
jgi:ribonuclease-3